MVIAAIVWIAFGALSSVAFVTGANGHWYVRGTRNWKVNGVIAMFGIVGLLSAVLTAPIVFH